MPFHRHETSSERRHRAADRIRQRGLVMSSICSACQARGLGCFVDPESGICSECYDHKRKCSLVVTDKDWKELDAKREQLERELEQTEEAISIYSAKRLRLRKQLGLLSSREKEMLHHELESIDELEELKHKEAENVSEPSRQLFLPLRVPPPRLRLISFFPIV